MIVAAAFMLWLVFQDGEDTELLDQGPGADEPQAGRERQAGQGGTRRGG
jgi:hypothetical protein